MRHAVNATLGVAMASFLLCGLPGTGVAEQTQPYHEWAQTPPMGWNSWDYYGTAITEQQAREQADAMEKTLLPAGYDIFTVDIQWYQPTAKTHYYDQGAIYNLSMDEYGRLTPAVNRFPSAANGVGFKELANYVHSKGMRFGIHIMRGMPKQAVKENTPVLGTDVRARDIAITSSTCPWNPDMYGVDATKPEGQAYYDSIIQMYADWGVDLIKCDDIARPYDDVQKAEIEALRKAIDKCGRPIVLSLSPGATPINKGPHVMEHANMWRISDDFWDRWGALREMFEQCHIWEPYRGPGHWPDADMIPFGYVEFGRKTNFTEDEHYTLMSLWSIARSPLIFGGDMTKLDDFTLGMLTNPEVLAVDQNSSNNHQVYRKNGLIVWAADVPDSNDKYVALFNAKSMNEALDFSDADYTSPTIAGVGKSQEITVNVEGGRQLVLFVKDGGDGFEYDHAAWVNPVLHGPNGELKLTDLQWKSATAGWGQPHVDQTCEGQPLMVDGQPATGIGTHAESTIVYDIPDGYDTFSVKGVMINKGSVQFGVLVNRTKAADFLSPVIDQMGDTTEDIKVSVKGGKQLELFVTDGGNGFEFDHAAWIDPVLEGPNGTLKLTDMQWRSATQGWGETLVNAECDGQPLSLNGQSVTGIGTHAPSVIVYDLPEGYDTFSAKGALTDHGSVQFGVRVKDESSAGGTEVSVDFKDLGIEGKAAVRDLWERKDVGTFSGSFSEKVPVHGARMYRLTPIQ